MTEVELKKLIGKPAWLMGDILEIRKSSDAEIAGIENGNIILKHLLFNKVSAIPISQICSIRRKDF